MARFTAPEGATGVHWNGQNYEVVEDGTLEAPEAAAADLAAHGYTPEPVKPAKAGK